MLFSGFVVKWKLLYSPWNSPGQNTGMGSLSLFQEIFPTQGSNPGLPHCRQILYQVSHKGSPRILEWVAYPFFSGSSWPRSQPGVSCIAGGFFPNWAIRVAPDIQFSWIMIKEYEFYLFIFIIAVVPGAAKSLQSCPTLCDPIDGSHQAPLSLGFSRQEHCSGLPFPSPMHESEKWKWSRSVVSDPQRLHGLQPSRLLRPWDFPGKSTGVGCH